jgi:uncharacterized protein YjbI with pentapeptide repeats
MTQPQDYSNQDLRNCSFRGKDLAGADFRKADIRGCDFRKANLEGADFSEVTAGQSSKQIFIAFGYAVMLALAVAVASMTATTSAFAGKVLVAFVTLFAILFAIAVGSARKYMVYLTFVGTYAILFAFAFAFAFAFVVAVTSAFVSTVAFAEFSRGNILGGVGLSLLSLSLMFLMYIFWNRFRQEIQKKVGTSFQEATLTYAKFTGAIINKCNFRDAILYQVDWTRADLAHSGFSGYLDNPLVRKLCTSRIGVNQDFSSIDLSGLNLIGVNLHGANLTAANLNETNLRQADLGNTNLCEIQAIKTDFTNANLTGACIENWAITPETIFTNVDCSHIFLDHAKSERKPASGSLERGDFAKLVTQSTKSLDFFFRNGIDPQAFDFALNSLKDEYGDMEISLKALEDLGDGDRLVRFNTVPNSPKAAMHAQFTQDYTAMYRQLEASREIVWELQQKLDRIDSSNKLERAETEKQLAVEKMRSEERLHRSQYLENLVYHKLGQPISITALNSQFGDITMTDKSIQSGGDVFFTGRDNLGVSGKDQQGVAGRDISGTVTNQYFGQFQKIEKKKPFIV